MRARTKKGIAFFMTGLLCLGMAMIYILFFNNMFWNLHEKDIVIHNAKVISYSQIKDATFNFNHNPKFINYITAELDNSKIVSFEETTHDMYDYNYKEGSEITVYEYNEKYQSNWASLMPEWRAVILAVFLIAAVVLMLMGFITLST